MGVQQALDLRTSEMENIFREKYFYRLKKTLQAKLNSEKTFSSINTWDPPSMTYTFGVVEWTTRELKQIDIRTGAIVTKFGIHHSPASSNRLYIPRHQGG